MRPFILLDLNSQADFIPREVRTWPRQRVVSWLRQFGEVVEWTNPAGQTVARFTARTGLTTTFILTDEGKLKIFLFEHVMRDAWR
jgi:hypothetical protein